MDSIKPRDSKEIAVVGAGTRIMVAMGIIGAMVPALLAAVGGLDWITANLTLLLTGLGSLVTGGVASYVAVRRMRIDRVACFLIALVIVLALCGCLTRTRCQQINARDCVINVTLNDPESMSENAYPRSLTIFSQDQMVEGGADTISSGNRTPVSALPMGDRAVEAVEAIATGGASRLADALDASTK